MAWFKIGDRVQVSDDWFVENLRGVTGTIIAPHDGVREPEEGVYWVAFEGRPDLKPNGSFTDSAEIDGASLILLPPANT